MPITLLRKDTGFFRRPSIKKKTMAAADWDHAHILASAQVVLFCRDNCAYCDRAKDLVRRENVPHRIIDISQHQRDGTPGFEAYYEMVRESTQARTVPIIFYEQRFIGGFEDLRNTLLFSIDF